MTGRARLLRALADEDLAFAPIVWEQLPALVRQDQADWWQDATTAQRLIGDAATLAGADAMFVFVADEAVRCALASGDTGDAALDDLASKPEARRGAELVKTLHDVAAYGVIAAVPAPASLRRALRGEEPEVAEDAFTDLVSAYLEAGADVVAVTGGERSEVSAGVERAASLGELFGRTVVGLCEREDETAAWTARGDAFGVISHAGEWPERASGVVITSGDVSARWGAPRLRQVGTARPLTRERA